MKTAVSIYDFHDWFSKSETYGNKFSYEGQNALFDYLEDYEDQTGETINFDPIALCVEFTEWDNALDCAVEHGYGREKPDPENPLEWLQDRTQVIEIPDSSRIIIQDF